MHVRQKKRKGLDRPPTKIGKRKSKGSPPYALEPMERFLAYVRTASQLLDVSIRAISASREMPGVFEAIAAVKRGDANWNEEDHKSTLERVKNDATFATTECDTGFPLLHEFTLVGVWGAFEAAIEDMIVGILSNEPDILRADPFARIRIPLADFETLDREDRMRILLRELQRTFRSDQRQGVTGFEAILGSVGMSGAIKDDIREGIWEMHHARNIIVHRRSCADRSFVAACPKFGLKMGDRIQITHPLLWRYVECLCRYGIDIVHRIGARYGVDMPKKPEFPQTE